MHKPKTVTGKLLFVDSSVNCLLRSLDERVRNMWANAELTTPSLHNMYRQVKIDELYHSNKIEGNSLTYAETVEVIQANKEILGKPPRDQQEARNLSDALDYVHDVGMDNSVTVTQNEIRRIHSLILKDIQADAGAYRTTQIEITDSRFAPPEAFLVPSFMTALSDYVRQETNPNAQHNDLPLFSAMAAHACLAQIHPFTDGNGRTARALMTLILIRRGYPPCIIEDNDRRPYIDALEVSRESGDLTSLTQLVCEKMNP